MGALARPHGRLQETKIRDKKSFVWLPAADRREKRRKGRCETPRCLVGCAKPARPRSARRWPVKPDRLDPPRALGGSRATPSGCADALRERRAAPAVFDDLCRDYTKINVSSSPAYFCITQVRITPNDAREGYLRIFITVASLFAPAPARVGSGAVRLA
ncbi:hypothetical protein VPH35_036975 [Triticum aestivum]